MVDPQLVATIAEEAPRALQWLVSFGVTFDFLPLYFLNQSTTRMAPVGGGLALIEALGRYIDTHPDHITIFYETVARSLTFDEHGALTGVQVVGRDNRSSSIAARNVVLASGGFEGNPEMMSHTSGRRLNSSDPVARGGYYKSRRRHPHGAGRRRCAMR